MNAVPEPGSLPWVLAFLIDRILRKRKECFSYGLPPYDQLGIVRLGGCQRESLEELKRSGFVNPFISGVLCITHWGQHNWIRKDRYTPSIHQEKHYVTVLRDRSYTVLDNCKSYVSHPGSSLDSQPGIPWDSPDDSQGEALWYDGPDDNWQPDDSQAAGKDFGKEEG